MSLASLPADLQCELLLYLPNFSVLNSLILCSRSFHSVFLTRRDLVLKHIAENLLGLELGEEMTADPVNTDHDTGDSDVFGTIKLLVQTREAVETLEPIVFRQLIHPDAHWDEPDRSPTLSESTRLRRAAYRFAKFCALPSEHRQSSFLARLETIQMFELVHFVEGLRKMTSSMLDTVGGKDEGSDDGRISRLVSTGPANICRLWKLRPPPQVEGDERSAQFAEFHKLIMAAAGEGTDEGAFDDAFHHFELSRNLSAFDAVRTRALLDVGQQQTEEVIVQLETLMEPPPVIPPQRPRRPRFRSLKLPLCDNSNTNSVRLPFLPDDLNSLPIRFDIPYAMLVLNGEPRIMPLTPDQLAELVMHL
ncbi:hypothetical protein B0H16DRAFT_456591 [Mycena metata]|uniref:F-box domain-containing protein n=1 Tax=Mycena metata TaxID=1033252 RepID=A0AAD7HAR2_9AGAR|nr:hypothetical protein B0H16DRAFT_456591 [Mycena metata]